MSHVVLDKYNLAISLLITIAWQCTGFFIAWTLQFDKITDFTGGSNFFILALITLCTGGTYHARNIVASVLVMVWSARLGGFLLFRVLKTGSDTRFDEMRSHFFKFAGFWVFQIVWVWVVCESCGPQGRTEISLRGVALTAALPTVVLNSPAVSDPLHGGGDYPFGHDAGDIIGLILFAVGLFCEAVGDVQKYRFKASKPPKSVPCTKGLWRYSRHPPYFGEITLHIGLYVLCHRGAVKASGARAAQYAAVLSPLLTAVLYVPLSSPMGEADRRLLFLSGIPTAEKPTAKKYYLLSHSPSSSDDSTEPNSSPSPSPAKNDAWANYKRYLASTSILVPLPPALYGRLPEWIKRSILLDLPMYRFDEVKDGREALEEEAKKRRQEA